jgi:uncharacterized protein YndB with AHSA1/START domain
MKWILWAFAVLAAILILVAVIGWLLPRQHIATRQGRYRQSPEAIWAAITDIDGSPSWREGLKSVKHLPDRNGLPGHVEVTSMGEIPLETIEMMPPRKLVRRIADPKLPFGGTWTFEITPTTDGVTLRITEDGFISNPVFRFLTRFVFGYTANLDSYLRSLAKKFGEQPRIEN